MTDADKPSATDCDTLQRFHFDEQPVRGAIITLNRSYHEAIDANHYPPAVKQVLGHCLAGVNLMAVNLKTPSRLSLQARGSGDVSLLMAETTTDFNVRAVAQWQRNETLDATQTNGGFSLADHLGDAQLAITIEPEAGQRYQGIVPVAADSLGYCLEGYFAQSEQLPTAFFLAADEQRAAGLMLQALPEAALNDEQINVWEELNVLMHSLTATELLSLPHQDTLHRLFHQHVVKLTEQHPIHFACSCSQQRTSQALLYMDPMELNEIIEQDGEIVVDCEFCKMRYRFSENDILLLNANRGDTRH